MIKDNLKSQYRPTIGIECHVQLKTKTKLFSAVANDARDAEPNTLVSHICLGMPGALPVLNTEAVRLAVRAAFALGVKPQTFSKFDRKHYFYPDLPKGYQISQFDQPIILGGHVDIKVDGQPVTINITRAHLEEDAGKSTHPIGKDYSLVDLNRAGTPLLEIVSEPEMHSAAEAKAYAKELHVLMRYADVSDADLYYGNMRFDVNISVSKSDKLGTRAEIKNLNSFRSVEKAVEYEIDRQIGILEKGEQVVQETRGWDDAKLKTFSQRTKEDAHDYRYFPDPDIPPVVLEDSYVTKVQNDMPTLPHILRTELVKLGIDSSAEETLVDEIIAGRFLLEVIQATQDNVIAKRVAGWLSGEIQAIVASSDRAWEELHLDVKSFLELAKMVAADKLSSTSAKVVLNEMITIGGDPGKIAEKNNLIQVSNSDEIEKIVQKVIDDNPKAAEDVRSGELKAVGFLVGQVMKESRGKANPAVAQKILKDLLS